MPASDYSSTISGGLKLKGGAKDAGVKKKKSKKSKAPREERDEDAKPILEKEKEAQPADEEEDTAKEENNPSDMTLALPNQEREVSSSYADVSGSGSGKTETQRRHEEIKRKRLDERLKREGGAKTHKQRVEELNKYLSTLSEHHDMPRIGPG